jgi:hypothetical protein
MWYTLKIADEIMNTQNHGSGFRLLAGAANRLGPERYILNIMNKIMNMQNLIFKVKYEAVLCK